MLPHCEARQVAGIITRCPTQSHPDTELTNPCPILVMLNARLDDATYQFYKSSLWFSWDSNSRPSSREACALPIRRPTFGPADRNLEYADLGKANWQEDWREYGLSCWHSINSPSINQPISQSCYCGWPVYNALTCKNCSSDSALYSLPPQSAAFCVTHFLSLHPFMFRDGRCPPFSGFSRFLIIVE